jgi:hypothetical protein
MKGKLSPWHLDRMRHLRDVRGLDLDAIGWLYGRRSAEEVQALLAAPAAPAQKTRKTRCSRQARYIPRTARRLNVRSKRVPDELVAEMHALHLGGLNLAAIGERYQRTNSAIRDLFLARGLPILKQPRRKSTKPRPYRPRPDAHNRVPDELVAEMHVLYLAGESTVTIGIRYHLNASTIAGYFKARGLEYPIARAYPKIMPKRVAAEEIAAMHALHLAGHTLAAIGRKFARSGKQVGHLFRNRGLSVRHVGRPPSNGRRDDGTFETYTPASEEVIEAAIQAATRICIPEHLRLDWRKWDMARRGDFIARIRARLASDRDRPELSFSANVEPFDYTSPRAQQIARDLALETRRIDNRICPCKIKLSSQGVIWRDGLWFWVANTGYVAGSWEPGKGRPALHRLIWEDHHDTKLQPGDVIRHADGNPNNLDPANLVLASRADLARENQQTRRNRESREKLSALLNRHQKKDPANHELLGQLLQPA